MKDNKKLKKFNYPFSDGGALTANDMNIIGDMMRALGWIDEQGNVLSQAGGDVTQISSSATEYANIEKNICIDFDFNILKPLLGEEILGYFPKDTIVRIPFNYCDIEPNKYYIANGRMKAEETSNLEDRSIVTLPIPVTTVLNSTPQNIVNRSSKLYSVTVEAFGQQLTLPFLYSNDDKTIDGYPYRMDFDASMIAAGFLTGISIPARLSLVFDVDPTIEENKNKKLISKPIISIMGFEIILEDIPTTTINKIFKGILNGQVNDVISNLQKYKKYVYGPDHTELDSQTKYYLNYTYDANNEGLFDIPQYYNRYTIDSNGKVTYDINGLKECHFSSQPNHDDDNYYYEVDFTKQDINDVRKHVENIINDQINTLDNFIDNILGIDRKGVEISILDTFTSDKMHSFMISALGLNELDPEEEMLGLKFFPGTNIAPEILCPFGPMLWFPGDIIENTTDKHKDYPYIFSAPIKLKYKLSNIIGLIESSVEDENAVVDININLYLKSSDKFAQGMAECHWSIDVSSTESSTVKESGTIYLHTFLLNSTDSYQKVNNNILKQFLLRFPSFATALSFTTNIPFVWGNNPPSLALGYMNEISIVNGIGTCIETPITNMLNINILGDQIKNYLKLLYNL